MRTLSFEIEGRPVPWKRQRTHGKRRFPAAGQETAKRRVRLAFREACTSDDIQTYPVAVGLTVKAVFKLPQRIPKGDPRRMGSPHTIRPDGDNLAKLVKDALNGLAYRDDCQVAWTNVEKQWSDHDRTVVTIEWIPVDRIVRAA